MSLFCLLCIPLLYLLRRSSGGGGESVWALPLGAAVVVVRYFTGPLVTPGGFGLSRWVSGFVDIAGLPALLPLIVCGALVILRVFPRDADYAGFALLWLVPLAAIRSINGDSPPSPLALIVVPLLWSAQALGISFFIDGMVKNPRGYIVFFATLGIAALPIAAVTSWWAFFSHQNLLGGGLLLLSVIPAVISMIGSRAQEAVTSERGDRNYIQILDSREWGVGSRE
jgi:hypothetical protein